MSAKLESHHQNGIKTVIIDADWLKTPLKEPRTVPVSLQSHGWMLRIRELAGPAPGKLRRMTSARKLAAGIPHPPSQAQQHSSRGLR